MAKIERRLGKIYSLWIAGLAVGAIGLKPDKANLAGVTFAIEHPEAIQGFLFFGCLCVYLAGAIDLFYRWPTLRRSSSFAERVAIYDELRLLRHRSLKNVSRADIARLKKGARDTLFRQAAWFWIRLGFPAVQIIVFEGKALWIAVWTII
jgi:hypothetical protein